MTRKSKRIQLVKCIINGSFMKSYTKAYSLHVPLSAWRVTKLMYFQFQNSRFPRHGCSTVKSNSYNLENGNWEFLIFKAEVGYSRRCKWCANATTGFSRKCLLLQSFCCYKTNTHLLYCSLKRKAKPLSLKFNRQPNKSFISKYCFIAYIKEIVAVKHK